MVESPGKTMSKKLGTAKPQGSLGPGPAGHSQEKLKTDDLKYSMGGKLSDIPFAKQMYKPGPGQHDPMLPDDSRKSQFPHENRPAVEKVGPSPANYEQVPSPLKKKNPTFIIGTSDRIDITK